MLLHVLLLRRTSQVTAIDRHVAYLERYHREGTFLLSGPAEHDGVDEVILAAGPREQIEQLAAEDPLVVAGQATYEIVAVDVTRRHDALALLLTTDEPADEPWDAAALARLRSGETAVLREDRPLEPVLQHAGQLLLAAAPANDEDLVRRCIAGLRERNAAGDDVLALELQAALGEPVASEHPPWPLTPVPVSLDELASCLDGDPLQGHGAVDLQTGDLYHPGTLEYDRPDELDEDSDSFDPDRWLFFHPESGDGYRDMLDFAADLPDGLLREQLFRALDGRGAFRRFRDVLSNDAHAVQLTRWLLFREERELGRARDWLATAGYRTDDPITPAQ
jgi:uncharacterized protein YciI